MTATQIRKCRVIDLVREEPSVILQLADLGISPRYLDWTVEAAASDLGLNLDRALARIGTAIEHATPGTEPRSAGG